MSIPDDCLFWGVESLLSCTAFEFGDPQLTAPAIHSSAHGLHASLHPSYGAGSPRRAPSIITATLYPLQSAAAAPLKAPKVGYGVPFHQCTVRVTRQSVSVYRSADRVFFADVRWSDVRDTKRHVPPEEPGLTELAIIFTRGVLVLDVASLPVAAGVWSAMQLAQHSTDNAISDALRHKRHIIGVPHREVPTSPSHESLGNAADDSAELVQRAKQVLDRFLGQGHNLSVTSPQRPATDSLAGPIHQQRLGVSSPSPPLLSPHDSPQHSQRASAVRASQPQPRSSSIVSLKDRADAVRREQDEQLQRLRRREESMRRDIQHTATSRSVTRSQSASSTAASSVRGPSVDAAQRRRLAAAAGNSQHLDATAAKSASRPPSVLPKPNLSSASATFTPISQHKATSRVESDTFVATADISSRGASDSVLRGTSQPPTQIRENNLLDELAFQDIAHSSASRQFQREEIASELSQLVDVLDAAERKATAGVAAQSMRLGATLQLFQTSSTIPTSASQVVKVPSTHDQSISTEFPRVEASPSVQVVAAQVAPPAARVEAVVAAPTAVTQVAPQQVSQSNEKEHQPKESQWQRKQTPEGREYYFNRITKATTWKIEETDLPRSSADAAGPRDVPLRTETPGEGWRAVKAGDGRTYYANKQTGKTTWKIEETHARDAAASQPAAAAPAKATEVIQSAPAVMTPAASDRATERNIETSTASPSLAMASTTSPANAVAAAEPKPAVAAVEFKPAQTLEPVRTPSAAAEIAKPIQDTEDTRQENEHRKHVAREKAEEDKRQLRFGKLTMMEALMREQAALAGGGETPRNEVKPSLAEITSAPLKPVVVEADSATLPKAEKSITSAESNIAAPAPQPAANLADAVKNATPGAVMYGPWKELVDKKSQRTYYKHTQSGEATWKVPPEVLSMKDELAKKEAAVNSAASPLAKDTTPSTQHQAASPPKNALRVAGDWYESLDAKSGRSFYVNTKTKERTWKIEQTPFASMLS